MGVPCHSGTTSQSTYSGLLSFPLSTPHLSLFTSEETSTKPSLEDILLESLQNMDTPWEEIIEDSPSKGNPWLDLENPNKERLEEAFNQNLPIHNMASVPPLGGNLPLLPPPSGNPLLPPPPGGNQPPPPLGSIPP